MAAILFLNLAQDLQLIVEIQEGKRSAGLDAADQSMPDPLVLGGKKHSELDAADGSSPNPLVQDLLQHPLHEIISTRFVFTTPPASKDNQFTAHGKRFTGAE